MDPLTHTLAGAALSEAGLHRTTRWALPVLIIGANLPDVDVLTYALGGDLALHLRRGFTHGALAMVVLPLLLASATIAADRVVAARRGRSSVPAGPILAVATIGVWSHPILDWLNTYGIRVLIPFDDRWLYGDALFIVDPWLWLLLGGGVYLARSARGAGGGRRWAPLALLAVAVVLLGPAGQEAQTLRVMWIVALSAIVLARRFRMTAARGERWAVSALAIGVLYASAMAALSATAANAVRSQLARWGTAASEVMAGPVPMRPLERIVLAKAPDGYRSGTFRPLRRPELLLDREPRDALPIELIRSPVIAEAWTSPAIRGFRAWARFPTATLETHPDGSATVYFLDLRYTDRPTRGFGGAVVEIDQVKDQRCWSDGMPPGAATRPNRG